MTELPRYIGRHASPGAARPSAGGPPPEDAASDDAASEYAASGHDGTPAAEPAMPRLEFDPSGADEPTTIIGPAQQFAEADLPEEPPSAAEDAPADRRWAERGGVESPAPGPEPAGPGPHRPGPHRPGPHRPGPVSMSDPPRISNPPGPPTDDPAAAPDTWTAPAPDIAPGPAPELEEAPEPEPESEVPTDAGAGSDDEAVPDDEPVPDDEAAARAWEVDEPDPPAGHEIDPGPEPIPEPEAEPHMPLRSESDWSATPVFPPSGGSPVRPVSAVSDIDSHGLARIALLDAVKEIWPGGTPDLSAWLAAHLELLEDPLGFSLTPRHHAPATAGPVVDDYDADQSPLDIPGNILTADLGGAAVMLRAQAHEADTEGLGALLGAAAMAQAQTAVWVCPRIDPGLRQALRWVGGDPSANVRLYGLEMYLVQIAGSPTAPLFDAVVSPGAP